MLSPAGGRAAISRGAAATRRASPGAQLSWNLWDFGRTQSRIAEAKATARARAELSAETSLQRRLEFTAADSAVRSAEARIVASRLAVEQARESLRIEQSKYDLGRGAIVDVLDAQSAAVSSRIAARARPGRLRRRRREPRFRRGPHFHSRGGYARASRRSFHFVGFHLNCPSPTRTSSHPLSSLGVVLSFAAALALAGCGKGGANGKPTPPPAVTVEAVASGPFRSLLAVTGTVEPTVVAGLASPAEGPVVDCRVREGDRVTAGQELLRIGRQLSAEAAQASAREELRRQEQEFRRTEALVAEKAIAGDLLDTARATLGRCARAALAQAEQAAGDYSIRAPWAGVVSRVRVADGTTWRRACRWSISTIPRAWCCALRCRRIMPSLLAAGGRVQETFDALAGRAFDLAIVRAYPDLDRRLRTRSFEADLRYT